MTDTPPPAPIEPWALTEARKRGGAPPAPYSDGTLDALARMIQTHETEPVPWDLKRAREICDEACLSDCYAGGHRDTSRPMKAVRAALNEPRPDCDTVTYKHAVRLLSALATKHGVVARHGPAPTTTGVLDQIDSITSMLHHPMNELRFTITEPSAGCGITDRTVSLDELTKLINTGCARLTRIALA